jgi:signal peptidase I
MRLLAIGALAASLAGTGGCARTFVIAGSSMEPTLHCARPGSGCEARVADRVRVQPYSSSPRRGDIGAVKAPAKAAIVCGSSGIFLKRIVGLPSEIVRERRGQIFVDGRKLSEPYGEPDRRDQMTGTWHVPLGTYFVLGDNRVLSCDSREWGSVSRRGLIGKVVGIRHGG